MNGSDRERRLYETVLSNTPDLAYVFDLGHRFTYANDALLAMWGRTWDEAIGKTCLELGYEPWHAAMHGREIDEVIATKQSIRGEVAFTGTNGTRQYDYIFVPIIGADGEVEAVAGTTRDVTERKEAEERLRASEERQTFLVKLADTLRPLSDPIEVQAEASRVLGEHLEANRVVYFETRGDECVIEQDYASGVRSLAGRYQMAAFGPAILEVLLEGRTVVETDATTVPSRSPAERTAFAAIEVLGHVDVPLIKEGRFVAGMTVHVRERREWTPAEVALIEETAERMWAAVERVRVEEALRQSEERSAFVRRSSGVGFWYCDLPFDVLHWDDLVKAHFHLPADAVVTIGTFFDRIHPEDREPTRQAIERSIAGRTPYDVNYRTVNPDTGAITWVRAIGRTAYAADGTPNRFDGVTLDVSEQKRAEAGLKESEERRRLALDAAELGAWHIDPVSNTLTTDERFRRLFSGTDAAIDYGEALARIHTDDRQRIRETMAEAAGSDNPAPFAEEFRVVHPDGKERWIHAKGRANYDRLEPRRLVSFDGTVADITGRKRIEEERERLVGELRDADRRKDEFLATLAHELRNPLAPIRNGLHMMQLAGVDGTIESARAMMERQLTQLVRLVDDLLDVSRVTSGKLELRRERIALREVVDAAVETIRPVLAQAGHELVVDLPDEPLHLDGDATRLAQVVSNLLSNSAKYTKAGGKIRLAAGREGETALLRVADNGIGIPPAMLGRVFDMFTQVDRALEKTTGGLGIGLSLVKGLVEMHGGTIEARSEGEGLGSEFVVCLPGVISSEENSEAPAGKDPMLPSSRRRILVADDNVDSAESLGQLLELLGYEVRLANDGLRAVEVAGGFRPQVVLLDIAMPGLNGYEVCRRIRGQDWGKNTILAAMTGWGQQEDQRRSKEAGFDLHFVKPVDPTALAKWMGSLQAGE